MDQRTTQQLTIVTRYVLRRLEREGSKADTHASLIARTSGYAGNSSFEAPVAGGDNSSVVERGLTDQELAHVRRWDEARRKLALALEAIDHALTGLLPPEQAPELPAGAGSCACCARWVSGSANDRLRSGLCDACRQSVQRMCHHDPTMDRGAAIARRRSQLASEPVGDVGTPATP